eukprot:sb/3476453/
MNGMGDKIRNEGDVFMKEHSPGATSTGADRSECGDLSGTLGSICDGRSQGNGWVSWTSGNLGDIGSLIHNLVVGRDQYSDHPAVKFRDCKIIVGFHLSAGFSGSGGTDGNGSGSHDT